MASNPYQTTPSPGNAPASKPVNGWGIAGFITSLVSLITCGLLSVISLPLSLIGLLYKPKGFAIAGTVISLLSVGMLVMVGWGIVAGFLGLKQVVTEAGKGIETVAALGQATMIIEEYRTKNNMLPDGIEGNKLIIEKKDAWEQNLRYEVTGDTYLIRSGGPDKMFDTPDDIKSNEHQSDTELNIETDSGMPFDGPVTIPDAESVTPESENVPATQE